jgi:hypothetical protein
MKAIFPPTTGSNHGRQTPFGDDLEQVIREPLAGLFRKAVLEGCSIREASAIAHRAVEDAAGGEAIHLAASVKPDPLDSAEHDQPAPDTTTLFVGPNGRSWTKEANDLVFELEAHLGALFRKALEGGRSLGDLEAIAYNAVYGAFLNVRMEMQTGK